jgi:hypothetical protein
MVTLLISQKCLGCDQFRSIEIALWGKSLSHTATHNAEKGVCHVYSFFVTHGFSFADVRGGKEIMSFDTGDIGIVHFFRVSIGGVCISEIECSCRVYSVKLSRKTHVLLNEESETSLAVSKILFIQAHPFHSTNLDEELFFLIIFQLFPEFTDVELLLLGFRAFIAEVAKFVAVEAANIF